MSALRSLVATATVVVLAACSAADSTAPLQSDAALASGSDLGTMAGVARVRCEKRTGSGARSVISVDGNNLTPRNGQFTARVTSGGNTASAPLARAVGDEVEFDFSSQRNDIAAGAVAIARTFITINPSAADVSASILDATGAVVATGSADCRTR